MRTASVRSSANAPSPEPRTSPICGRSLVWEKMNAAADSARVNRSGFINNYVAADAFVRPHRAMPDGDLILTLKFNESPFQLPLHASALIGPDKLLTFPGNAITAHLLAQASLRSPQLPPITPQTLSRYKTVFQAL